MMTTTLAHKFVNELDVPEWQKYPVKKLQSFITFHSIMYSQTDFIKIFYDKHTPKDMFKIASGYTVCVRNYHAYMPWLSGDFFYRACEKKLIDHMGDYPDAVHNAIALKNKDKYFYQRGRMLRHVAKLYRKSNDYSDDSLYLETTLRFYSFLNLPLLLLRPFTDQSTHDKLIEIFYHLSIGFSYLYDATMYTQNSVLMMLFPKLEEYQWINHIPLIRRPLTYSALCAKDEIKKELGINLKYHGNLAMEPYLIASSVFLRFLQMAEKHLTITRDLMADLETLKNVSTKRCSRQFDLMVQEPVKLQQYYQEHFNA